MTSFKNIVDTEENENSTSLRRHQTHYNKIVLQSNIDI